jgi:hypothetical protein
MCSPGLKQKRFYPMFAVTIYSALSLFYFRPATLPQWWTNYRGIAADPTIHIWAMTWWPYAIAHGFNPLITPVIFAPGGYNLARAVSMPGPSLIIYPVTKVFGPLVAYNFLCVACPVAAALSAFVLCRYVCDCFWPALLGGYLFGFSQYVLSQMGGHLFLLFIFPVPLAIYVVLRRLHGSLGQYSFLVFFVLLIGFEFLSSTELFATTTVFGATALALSVALFWESRAKLTNAISDVALAYALLIVMLSPYLYHVLIGGVPQVANPAQDFSNDLLAFVLPTRQLVGGRFFDATTSKFKNTWWEMGAYLGPGVWLVMALFARKYWRTRAGKLLLLSFGFIAVASLGPKLHVAGSPSVKLPWVIADKLPLIDLALPGRFGMYLFLIAAVIVAIHLSGQGIAVWSKGLLGACALAFIVPNVAFIHSETTKVDTPSFFRSGEYKHYISRGDIVLILPDAMSSTGQALLWQAQTNFYFRSATGFYLAPEDYQHWPIAASFVSGVKIPDFSEQLDAFLGSHQVKAIIVDGASPGPWPRMLSKAGMSAIVTGGVFFYKVAPYVLASFGGVSAHLAAEKEAAVCFSALAIAANKYVEMRFPLDKLAPAEVHRLGLLGGLQDQAPPAEDSNWWQTFWLGSLGGLIGVGDAGNYEDLEFLIHEYGSNAALILFPFPKKLAKDSNRGDGMLLFFFTPEGLRRVASKAIDEPLTGLNRNWSVSFNSLNR